MSFHSAIATRNAMWVVILVFALLYLTALSHLILSCLVVRSSPGYSGLHLVTTTVLMHVKLEGAGAGAARASYGPGRTPRRPAAGRR
jgi:hypothetical protein